MGDASLARRPRILVTPAPALPRGPRTMVYQPPAPDLALLATAAADAWAQGKHIPAPSAKAAWWLLRACRAVGRRHHITVTDAYAGRCRVVLERLLVLVCEQPAERRRAVLCGVLLDLLNDRGETGFADVSDALARVDRELAPTAADTVAAARITDIVRGEAARG